MYLYTLSMSRKIREICDKKYVPRAVATLVFVCNKQKFQRKIRFLIKMKCMYDKRQKYKIVEILENLQDSQ